MFRSNTKLSLCSVTGTGLPIYCVSKKVQSDAKVRIPTTVSSVALSGFECPATAVYNGLHDVLSGKFCSFLAMSNNHWSTPKYLSTRTNGCTGSCIMARSVNGDRTSTDDVQCRFTNHIGLTNGCSGRIGMFFDPINGVTCDLIGCRRTWFTGQNGPFPKGIPRLGQHYIDPSWTLISLHVTVPSCCTTQGRIGITLLDNDRPFRIGVLYSSDTFNVCCCNMVRNVIWSNRYYWILAYCNPPVHSIFVVVISSGR